MAEPPLAGPVEEGYVERRDTVDTLERVRVPLAAEGRKNVVKEDLGAGEDVEALLQAVMFGTVHAVRTLLEEGGSPDCTDRNGYTGLHWAACNGRKEIALMLLAHGANIDAVDSNGWTPLHHASKNGRLAIVTVLLNKDADPLVKNSQGKRARHLAKTRAIASKIRAAEKRRGGGKKFDLGKALAKLSVLSSSWFGGRKKSKDKRDPSKSVAGGTLSIQNLSEEGLAFLKEMEELEREEEEMRERGQEVTRKEEEVHARQKDAKLQMARIERARAELTAREEMLTVREKQVSDFEEMVRGLEEAALTKTRDERLLDKMIVAVDFEKDLEIISALGSGSFADVLLAKWRGDIVAVKKLKNQSSDADLQDAFLKETLLLSKMRHPNIVLIMGACTIFPNLTIITELMERGDLFTLLHNDPTHLDWDLRLQIAADMARGMNYLHCMKPPMVHRDLKSNNILIDERWRAKVSDFGTTRTKEHTMVQTATAVGTPGWMAPECLRGEDFDESSDVYSFGVCMWEILTRVVPWHEKEPLQIIGAVGFKGNRLPVGDPPPGCPPEFSTLLEQCFLDATERPTFSHILDEIEKMQ